LQPRILSLDFFTKQKVEDDLRFEGHETISYGKNDFVKVSKNLASYRSENNFVGPSKIIM